MGLGTWIRHYRLVKVPKGVKRRKEGLQKGYLILWALMFSSLRKKTTFELRGVSLEYKCSNIYDISLWLERLGKDSAKTPRAVRGLETCWSRDRIYLYISCGRPWDNEWMNKQTNKQINKQTIRKGKYSISFSWYFGTQKCSPRLWNSADSPD